MSKYVFLLKNNIDNNRDCVAYVEIPMIRFECGHYFSGINLHGACYSSCFKTSAVTNPHAGQLYEFENITTILTKEEFNELLQIAEDVSQLGYSIKPETNDERYQKGLDLQKQIQPIEDKLLSKDNQKLFEQIQKEEQEILMDEYGFNEDDIEEIFNNYYLDYRDRGIVSCVFDSSEDCGYEEAWSLGYINDNDSISSCYFDYERFGRDIVNDDERYLEINDGRVVCLNY